MNLQEFWVGHHQTKDTRWLTCSEPATIINRLGVDLMGVLTALEVGPGVGLLASYLRSLSISVWTHDIVPLSDPFFVDTLPLKFPVDIAVAHLVIQHVPDHKKLIADVVSSLYPGGTFYFDAVTPDYVHAFPEIANEYERGESFPFDAWDLVDELREITQGWYACKAIKK